MWVQEWDLTGVLQVVSVTAGQQLDHSSVELDVFFISNVQLQGAQANRKNYSKFELMRILQERLLTNY